MRAALPQSSPSPWSLRGVVVTLLLAAALLPVSHAQTVTFTGSGAVNFGSVNVCPSGQTTPAPCSNTLTLSYNVTASGTLGTPQVLTTGAPNLDFTLASGSTCSDAVTQGNTCTVKVTFAPLAPGLRKGAVQIVDSSGYLLANTYIYGTGVGPAIAFNPPPQRSLPGLGGYALAVDASGDAFVINGVYKGVGYPLMEILAVNGSIPANPTVNTLVSSGLSNPTGVAVDGSGNVFVADSDIPPTDNSVVVKEILAVHGSIPANPTIKTLASGFSGPIAVDGSGNVFVTTATTSYRGIPSGTVQEILAGSGGIPANPTVNTLVSTGISDPTGLAVDASGNLFVSDQGEFALVGDKFVTYPAGIKEILAVDGTIPANPTVKSLDSGAAEYFYSDIETIAVDAGGNVFFTDDGVYELLAAGGYTSIDTLSIPATYKAEAVAVDGGGNLFVLGQLQNSTQGDLFEFQRSQPPPLSFATTTPGSISSDSPQSVQIQNIGTANLKGTVPSVSPNWDLVPGSGTPADCAASFSLASGAACNLSISFEPTEDGAFTGAVTLNDNALNTTSATQSVPLSGTGASPSITGLSANYGASYALITLTGKPSGEARD